MKINIKGISTFMLALLFLVPNAAAVNFKTSVTDPANSDLTDRASSSKTTYHNFICKVGGNFGGVTPPSSEVYVLVSGNYEVDIANNIVTKVSSFSPTVIITGHGDIYGSPHYIVTILSKHATHTSSRATFTVTFKISVTYGTGEVPTDCGTYTIFIEGDAKGGEAVNYTNMGMSNPTINPN